MTIPLTQKQKLALKLVLHFKIKEKADRLNIVVMFDNGYSISQISEALMLDVDTISKWELQLRREARLQAISELAFAKQKMCNPKKTFEGFLQ